MNSSDLMSFHLLLTHCTLGHILNLLHKRLQTHYSYFVKNPHWLQINYRIMFKILHTTYKALNLARSYIRDLHFTFHLVSYVHD